MFFILKVVLYIFMIFSTFRIMVGNKCVSSWIRLNSVPEYGVK